VTADEKTCRWCEFYVPRGPGFCTQKDAGLKQLVSGRRTEPVIPLKRGPDETCSCWRERKFEGDAAEYDRQDRETMT